MEFATTIASPAFLNGIAEPASFRDDLSRIPACRFRIGQLPDESLKSITVAEPGLPRARLHGSAEIAS